MSLNYTGLCITSWYHTETDSFNHTAPPGIAHKLKREIPPLGSTPHGPHHQEREQSEVHTHFRKENNHIARFPQKKKKVRIITEGRATWTDLFDQVRKCFCPMQRLTKKSWLWRRLSESCGIM